MKLRSLEAFCAAVEEQSISGAARRMYLSQPSVSERVADLEREARVPLLKRSRQGVIPTTQGALLYEHARKVLDEVKALEQALHALRSKSDMRLRLAASSTLGEHLLPEWLWGFRKELPGTIPELLIGNTQEVISVISSGEMSLGVIESEGLHGSLKSVPLLDDELVVVVASDHPWSERHITAQDLPKEPFVSRERGSGTREVIERALEGMSGVDLDVQMELGSTSAVKEVLETGLGFSILSRAAIQRELKAGTLAIAKGFTIPRRFIMIQHPSAILNPAEQRFHDYLMGLRKRYRDQHT